MKDYQPVHQVTLQDIVLAGYGQLELQPDQESRIFVTLDCLFSSFFFFFPNVCAEAN